MNTKPSHKSGYSSEAGEQVRATCLYLATKLGDLSERFVVVGGLVPTLLIDQTDARIEPHVGTMDLDVGLAIAILEDEQYDALAERLREAGFAPDTGDNGALIRQRWQIRAARKITLDFLIAPSRSGDRGGKLRNIRPDLAAFIVPGLELAFTDKRIVDLRGQTIKGEQANREIGVCGPGAYVILKALAFGNRGMNKDAYDLYYTVRNFDAGPRAVADCLRPLTSTSYAKSALSIIARDFTAFDAIGPKRVAEFLTGGPDDEIQADVVGFMAELLGALS